MFYACICESEYVCVCLSVCACVCTRVCVCVCVCVRVRRVCTWFTHDTISQYVQCVSTHWLGMQHHKLDKTLTLELQKENILTLFRLSMCCYGTPEGRPGMSDVSFLSGISGLSFDSTLLSPLVFFCLVYFIFFCLLVLSPELFPENSSIFFVKR